MDISTALKLVFTAAENFKGTREEHQKIFEAQETIINYLREINANTSQDNGKEFTTNSD